MQQQDLQILEAIFNTPYSDPLYRKFVYEFEQIQGWHYFDHASRKSFLNSYDCGNIDQMIYEESLVFATIECELLCNELIGSMKISVLRSLAHESGWQSKCGVEE